MTLGLSFLAFFFAVVAVLFLAPGASADYNFHSYSNAAYATYVSYAVPAAATVYPYNAFVQPIVYRSSDSVVYGTYYRPTYVSYGRVYNVIQAVHAIRHYIRHSGDDDDD